MSTATEDYNNSTGSNNSTMVSFCEQFHPCQRGGTCIDLENNNKYECQCPELTLNEINLNLLLQSSDCVVSEPPSFSPSGIQEATGQVLVVMTVASIVTVGIATVGTVAATPSLLAPAVAGLSGLL
jgi:hypothetical protein